MAAPRDLLLDTTTHDLVLDAGDLQLVGGEAAIAQECRMRLRTDRGEYFLDAARGLPFSSEWTGPATPAKLRRIELLTRAELLQVLGVTRIEPATVEAIYDRTIKKITVTAQVQVNEALLAIEEVL